MHTSIRSKNVYLSVGVVGLGGVFPLGWLEAVGSRRSVAHSGRFESTTSSTNRVCAVVRPVFAVTPTCMRS